MIRKIELLNMYECLKDIQNFANNYPSYLSESSTEARAYKRGHFIARDIINDILNLYDLNDSLPDIDFTKEILIKN